MADRAVSDVVSFVLVFSLITTTTGVVLVSGFGALNDVRTAEQVDNADRAFEILAHNAADLHRRGAPSRATEIKLADAQLRFDDATTLTVEITNLAPTPTYSTDIDPIVYSSTAGRDTELVYEGGAVVRAEGDDGALLKRPPEMHFVQHADGTTTATIGLVQTQASGVTSVGGSTTVLVRMDRTVSEVLAAHTDPATTYDVELTVVTAEQRAEAWRRNLNTMVPWADPCSAAGDTVTCSFSADRIFVTATRIEAEFN